MDQLSLIDPVRHALLRLVSALMGSVGMAGGQPVSILSRGRRAGVLRMLGPAESAARRVVLVTLYALLARGEGSMRRGPRKAPGNKPPSGNGKARAPVFCLFDPRKFFAELAAMQQRYTRTPPRAGAIDAANALGRTAPPPPEPVPGADDPVDGTALCRRLLALQGALGNPERQARRLLRRRQRDPDAFALKGPMRPGRPPGHRVHRLHPVDDALHNAHVMALRARDAFDTS